MAPLLPSDHLLPSELTTCGPHVQLIMASARPSGSYHFGDKVWIVVEDETMEIPAGDKVPLRDNRSATHKKTVLKK